MDKKVSFRGYASQVVDFLEFCFVLLVLPLKPLMLILSICVLVWIIQDAVGPIWFLSNQ